MIQTELEALHRQLLDLTKAVVEVCEENGISYYLSSGSCLGAIRHHDIIPWDDDVDLGIHYRDYHTLAQAFADNKDFFYQDIETDPEYFQHWPKLRKNHTTSMDVHYRQMSMHWGICVDLFPLVPYDKPEVDRKTKIKLRALSVLARLPYYRTMGTSFQHKVWAALYKILGQKGRKKLFFRIMDSIAVPEGAYLLEIDNTPYGFIVHKDVYGEGVPAQLHDLSAKVPSDWDQYLKTLYGDDYMEIPPEDSSLRYCHSSSLVDCEKDYSFYQTSEDISPS